MKFEQQKNHIRDSTMAFVSLRSNHIERDKKKQQFFSATFCECTEHDVTKKVEENRF